MKMIKNGKGQATVEYALLLAVLALAVIFIIFSLNTTIGSIFSKVNSKLATANQEVR